MASRSRPRRRLALVQVASLLLALVFGVVLFGVEAAAQTSAAAAALEGTVVQTKEDLPRDLTDEQRTALGVGKVPIHREGAFRSPFARPGFGKPARVKVGLVVANVRGYDVRTGPSTPISRSR